jgi:hypothetical protein
VMHHLWQSRIVRIGLGAVCLGIVLLGSALRGALRVETVKWDVGRTASPGFPIAPGATFGYSLDRVLIAVEKDPFNHGRRRPLTRFQMPSEANPAVQLEASRAPESLAIVGTAVSADGGGFAMCTWQGGRPKIVRVGEKVGDWTLHRVWQGAAEFVKPGGSTVTVRVSRVGA